MKIENWRESTVELATGGLLILVFALFLLGDISSPLMMMVGGIVLLGSGYYQKQRGWHVSWLTWIVGVILLLGGLGMRIFLVSVLQINWVAIALLLVVGYVAWGVFSRRKQ